ncbi:MAG: hypothetical protein J6Y56_09195 [Fibrobacterales bacterium]|nr:hypothetical protein [Fibrobacterales bacterium]
MIEALLPPVFILAVLAALAFSIRRLRVRRHFAVSEMLLSVCLPLNVLLFAYALASCGEYETVNGHIRPVADISASEKIVALEVSHGDVSDYHFAIQTTRNQKTFSPFLTLIPSRRAPYCDLGEILVDTAGVLKLLTGCKDVTTIVSVDDGVFREVEIRTGVSGKELYASEGFELGKTSFSEDDFRITREMSGRAGYAFADNVLFWICIPLNTILLVCLLLSSLKNRAAKGRPEQEPAVPGADKPEVPKSKAAKILSFASSLVHMSILLFAFLLVALFFAFMAIAMFVPH